MRRFRAQVRGAAASPPAERDLFIPSSFVACYAWGRFARSCRELPIIFILYSMILLLPFAIGVRPGCWRRPFSRR